MQGAPYVGSASPKSAYTSIIRPVNPMQSRGCANLRKYVSIDTCLFFCVMLQMIVTMIITAFLIVIASKTVPFMKQMDADQDTVQSVVAVPVVGSIVQGLRPAVSENSIAARDRGLLIAYSIVQVLTVRKMSYSMSLEIKNSSLSWLTLPSLPHCSQPGSPYL